MQASAIGDHQIHDPTAAPLDISQESLKFYYQSTFCPVCQMYPLTVSPLLHQYIGLEIHLRGFQYNWTGGIHTSELLRMTRYDRGNLIHLQGRDYI